MVLEDLRKSIKKKKAKAKAKRNKRQRKRARRRKKFESVTDDLTELGSDVGDIFGASRAGGAARGAGRAARTTARGAKKAAKAADSGLDALEGFAGGPMEMGLAAGEITVSDLRSRLKSINDPGTLDRLAQAERRGKNRQSALSAIRSRKSKLQSEQRSGGMVGGGEPLFSPPDEDDTIKFI